MTGRKARLEFPKTLAAIEAAELDDTQHQWRIGDALIEEVGLPQSPGVNDGSTKDFERLAEELETRGYEKYSVDHLRDLRNTAAAFPAGERSPSIYWSIHSLAGSPQALAAAGRQANNERRRLTAKYMRTFNAIRARQQQGREAEQRLLEIDVRKARKALADAVQQMETASSYLKPHFDQLAPRQVKEVEQRAEQVIELAKQIRDGMQRLPLLSEAAE